MQARRLREARGCIALEARHGQSGSLNSERRRQVTFHLASQMKNNMMKLHAIELPQETALSCIDRIGRRSASFQGCTVSDGRAYLLASSQRCRSPVGRATALKNG